MTHTGAAFILDRRTFLGLAGAGSLFALAACASPQDGSSGGQADDTPQVLKWANSYGPSTWDPIVQGSGFAFNQTALVYASLTEINSAGEAAPGLAESWTYNDAGDAVTFHLREGLVFQDGEPLNAEAVKLYLERAKTQEDSALRGDLTSIDTVTADSELDVTLHLTQVDHQIPLLLGRRVAQITSPAVSPAELATAPVGAGPFTVLELVPESHVYLEKNPDYWDAANILIDRVELTWGLDAASIVSALQTGVYNFSDLAAAQAAAAESASLDVVVHPGFNASNISVNSLKVPFDDPAVLDAARHAINRAEFVDKLSFGYGKATAQPFPEGYVAWSSEVEDPWPYDPDTSRQLLSDAGYSDGDITVDLVVSSDVPQNEIIQSQLAAVGITATIKVETNWAEPFFAKELVLSTYGTTGRESPVQTLTAHFGPEGPLNLSAPYVSDEFLEAVKVARETPLDSPDYAANLQAATAVGVRTSPTIFTYSQPNLFVKKGVSDIPPVPGQIHWTGVSVTA